MKVRVLSVDRERQRIALSIKALAPDPWETAPERYPIGCLTMGKVSQVVDFGSFIELEPGVEGLLHNSELRDFEQREELNTSEPVLVKVIRVEPERRRIGLSVRQVRPEEWEDWVIEQAEAEEAARLKAEEEAKAKAAAAEEQVLDEEQSVAVSAEAESTDEIVQPVVVDETAVSESNDSEAQAAETEDEIIKKEEVAVTEKYK